MLTIRYEIKPREQKKDGTYNIKLRFTLNRQIKRISTSLFATPSDLTKSGELKHASTLYAEVERLIAAYREKCNAMQIDINGYSLEDIFLRFSFEELKRKDVDFIEFCRDWIKISDLKGAVNYTTAINSFVRYLGKDSIKITQVTKQLLMGFMDYLGDRSRARALAQEKDYISNRTTTLYLGCLRHLYQQAQEKYNNYDAGLVLLPNSPFMTLKLPRQVYTRKRALSEKQIRKIHELPYKEKRSGYKSTCRFDLAKDCFILSFCLMGINSVDLFNVTTFTGTTLKYNRTKTKDRRIDKAEMHVIVPRIAMSILKKYLDLSKKRVFVFYKYYANSDAFNKAINYGLKEIGKQLGISDLEYYAARHSWATIAINKVGVDKYTVHSALNHADMDMRVTDMYIYKDFVVENNANKKVIDFVFGKDSY